MIPTMFDIAHITITFTSPLIVATGTSTDVTDAVCMYDPNGIPTIPGTSITGALRHAFAESHEKLETTIFGSTDGEGSRSLVTVSWAHAHNVADKPVSHVAGSTNPDSVTQFLQNGVLRDHVRIDENTGAAAHTGKFEETLVPRGARFTFALMLDRKEQTDITIDTLIELLQQPNFFLGGKSRCGFGAFEVTKVQKQFFNLNNIEDLKRFSTYSFDVSVPYAFESVTTPTISKQDRASYKLEIRAKDFLLPGGGIGIDAVFDAKQNEVLEEQLQHTDIFPVYESAIVWKSGRGSVEKPRFYLPATSIKGTLRHRTTFYTRVLCQEWVGTQDTVATMLMNNFFGTEKEHSTPGVVYFSEPIFSTETSFRVMQHVALDRFTQGPLQSALFGEVLLELANKVFFIDVVVDWKKLQKRLKEDQILIIKKAFTLALTDLVKGRLSLGAAGSRGHGLVVGKLHEFDGE